METKDDKSLTTIKRVNLKLVFGSSPDHEPHIIDITDTIPREMLREFDHDQSVMDPEIKEHVDELMPSVIGFSPKIIGTIETFYDSEGKSERLFLPLLNPFGVFVSIQQGINRILRGAIVNQKQLDALLESVDEIFKNAEKEHRQGVEYIYKEKGL